MSFKTMVSNPFAATILAAAVEARAKEHSALLVQRGDLRIFVPVELS